MWFFCFFSSLSLSLPCALCTRTWVSNNKYSNDECHGNVGLHNWYTITREINLWKSGANSLCSFIFFFFGIYLFVNERRVGRFWWNCEFSSVFFFFLLHFTHKSLNANTQRLVFLCLSLQLCAPNSITPLSQSQLS